MLRNTIICGCRRINNKVCLVNTSWDFIRQYTWKCNSHNGRKLNIYLRHSYGVLCPYKVKIFHLMHQIIISSLVKIVALLWLESCVVCSGLLHFSFCLKSVAAHIVLLYVSRGKTVWLRYLPFTFSCLVIFNGFASYLDR